MGTNENEAIFSVKYSGLPEPMPTWHDIDGNQIPWANKTNKFEATLDQQNQQTALKIKNPLVTDSGWYILLADNGLIQKEHEFQMLVKGLRIPFFVQKHK